MVASVSVDRVTGVFRSVRDTYQKLLGRTSRSDRAMPLNELGPRRFRRQATSLIIER